MAAPSTARTSTTGLLDLFGPGGLYEHHTSSLSASHILEPNSFIDLGMARVNDRVRVHGYDGVDTSESRGAIVRIIPSSSSLRGLPGAMIQMDPSSADGVGAVVQVALLPVCPPLAEDRVQVGDTVRWEHHPASDSDSASAAVHTCKVLEVFPRSVVCTALSDLDGQKHRVGRYTIVSRATAVSL
jgi:hypothetical protein